MTARGGSARWLVGAAALVWPACVLADPPPPSSTEVVVTASHLPQSQGRPTVDVTVLTPEAAPAGATLGEVLATESDIAVQQPGGSAGVGSVFLRGAKPNFTLVMIDGVPLNDQTNSRGGSTDVSALNVLGFDRVEVVRGALSSIYGSGAMEGAINLIPPEGAPTPTGEIAVGGGTDRSAMGAALVRGPLGDGVGGALTADWVDAGHNIESSSRVNGSVLARIAPLDGSDQYGLTVRYAQSDAAAFPDDSGGPRLAVLRAVEHTRDDQLLAGGHWRFRLQPTLSLELSGAGTESRLNDDTPGVAPGVGSPVGAPSGTSEDTYWLARGEAILRWTPSPAWRGLVGLEADQEEGKDVSQLFLFGTPFPSRYRLSRTTLAAFAEADADLGRLSLDSSLRVDRPSGLGAHLTGQLGAAYRLTPRLRLHASVGHSFKAPSFYGLGNAFVGNPGLKPETADIAEAGATWLAADGLSLEANFFRTQYHQLVDLETGPPLRLVNRSSVLSQGAQVTLHAPLTDRGALRVSASYIDTHDQSDGARLLELPPWRVTAALDWRFSNRVRGRIDLSSEGDRLDSSIPTGNVILPPYAVADARLFWALDARDDLEASVENALDRRYEDAIGFPSPGVTGRLSLVRRY